MGIVQLMLCIFFSMSINVQDIPKNATIIVVNGTTFDKVVNNLLDSGYNIEKIDKEYKTLRTEPKNLCKDCLPKYALDIRVKDSAAIISGKWNSMSLEFEIKNEKDKVPKAIFKAMNSFALSLNGRISYLVEK